MKEVIDVLRRGPGYNPDPTCTTRKNEAVLGLPASVYAYLGKTVPDFGDAAFALPFDALEGADMSPFDTGGLVKHITPVSARPDADKRTFLASYTFDSRRRRRLVVSYPGTSRMEIDRYLDGQRPSGHDGPHRVWPKAPVTDPAIAAIWHARNDWQAWTWEGRVRNTLRIRKLPYRWSCSPALFQRVREYAERVAKGAEAKFLDELLALYVRGGVSRLVADLRKEQLP